MVRWVYKILMLMAVTTIVGHSSLPHHHHNEVDKLSRHHANHHHNDATGHHHHDHPQQPAESHNIFSYGSLADDFLPTQFSTFSGNLPVFYLVSSIISIHFNQIKEGPKCQFNFYREFPPPRYISPQLFSRPPPAFLAA